MDVDQVNRQALNGNGNLRQAETSNETAVIIRTHFYEEFMGEMADRMYEECGINAIFVLDERLGEVKIPDRFRKIGVSNRIIEKLGLFVAHDWGWRCGDYFFYAARLILQEYKFFWIIEPDVKLNFFDYKLFFNVFQGNDEVDCLGVEIGIADKLWFWHKMMEPFASGPIFRCLYPLMRLSARAIDHLYEQRKKMSSVFKMMDNQASQKSLELEWPNDEAFTVTTLYQDGFNCQEISKFGAFYDRSTFRFGWPFSSHAISTRKDDKKIYHPVLNGMDFVKSVLKQLSHDVQVQQSCDYINIRYQAPELLSDVFAESGEDGIKLLHHERLSALEILAMKEKTVIRNKIVSQLWRGLDPLKDFPVDRAKFDPQGWHSNHPFLTESIDMSHPSVIVEIGVWKGGSVLAMAQHAKTQGLESESE